MPPDPAGKCGPKCKCPSCRAEKVRRAERVRDRLLAIERARAESGGRLSADEERRLQYACDVVADAFANSTGAEIPKEENTHRLGHSKSATVDDQRELWNGQTVAPALAVHRDWVEARMLGAGMAAHRQELERVRLAREALILQLSINNVPVKEIARRVGLKSHSRVVEIAKRLRTEAFGRARQVGKIEISCEHCGKAIPFSIGGRRRFCPAAEGKASCRQAAYWARRGWVGQRKRRLTRRVTLQLALQVAARRNQP